MYGCARWKNTANIQNLKNVLNASCLHGAGDAPPWQVEDCAAAAENMMLAADSLGVGSCYIGQGWTAFADPYGQEILKKWKIRTDYYAVMQLLLGYPQKGDSHPTAKPRKEDRIIRV